MVFTLIEHKNNVKMSQNVQNWSGTKSRRRVISMQSFDRFDAISMVNKDTNHGKMLSTGNFKITLTFLTSIWLNVLLFVGKWRARERRKHFAPPSMVCTLIKHNSLLTSEREIAQLLSSFDTFYFIDCNL